MTIREMVNERLNFVRDNIRDMDPTTAADVSTDLSLILGQVGDHEAGMRQNAYKVLILALEGETSHAKAESLMFASDEYKEYKRVQALKEAVLETIRSLRNKVRSMEKEYEAIN